LILCDVDFFKAYNDFYGHQQGDKCLEEIANVLRSSTLRSSDFVARYGGEEFAIVMPQTDEAGAIKIATNIHNELKQRQLPHAQSNVSEYITISIGLAIVEAGQIITAKSIIKTADEALYKAKKGGRNRTTLLNL